MGNRLSIIAVAISTIITSTGQLCLKLGAGRPIALDNYLLGLGIVLYGMAAVLLLIALRFGELSVIYPIYSLSFVWVALLSSYLLGEPIGVLQAAAIPVILGGVCLIGVGGSHA